MRFFVLFFGAELLFFDNELTDFEKISVKKNSEKRLQ
jgi:hypothetical protein